MLVPVHFSVCEWPGLMLSRKSVFGIGNSFSITKSKITKYLTQEELWFLPSTLSGALPCGFLALCTPAAVGLKTLSWRWASLHTASSIRAQTATSVSGTFPALSTVSGTLQNTLSDSQNEDVFRVHKIYRWQSGLISSNYLKQIQMLSTNWIESQFLNGNE